MKLPAFLKTADNKPRLLLLSVLHGLFLIVVTLLYLWLPFMLDDEVVLIKVTAGVKNKLLQQKRRPDPERFLFINVSWEKKLIPKLDSNGFVIGKQAITDRKSLAALLNKMNMKPDNHEFLVVDVNFIDPTEDDSLLQAETSKITNCLMSYHKGKDDRPIIPIIKGPLGLSDMQVDDEEKNLVLKYHLIQGDSLKTTPLLMYEKIHGEQLQHAMLYDWLNGRPIFNSFILDYPLDNFDLFQKKLYNYMYLSELRHMPPEFIHQITKDKIVFIGDFEDRDIHNTIYGYMPGPFILLNAFLALERGDNVLSPWFLLWLLLAFSLISYKAINVNDPLTVWAKNRFKDNNAIAEFTVDATFYLGYFGLISLICYFFFNIHLTILIFSFYLSGLEWLILSIHDRKRKKAKKATAASPEKLMAEETENPALNTGSST